MAQKQKWCKTMSEARKLVKQRQSEDVFNRNHVKVYKVRGKYLVGDHWTWLAAVS